MERKSTILIADDEPSARDTLEALLFREGYDLTFAASGQEALACLDDLAPDVILLDVMMPELDGFEVCRRIKADERWRHIPVILVTALGSKEDLAHGLDAGADDFLHKPVNGIELRARVRSMLRIKRQFDELEATMRLREDLSHMIVHDMRSPLTLIWMTIPAIERSITEPQELRYLDMIETEIRRLDSFLNDMLMLAKMQENRLILNRSQVDVNRIVQAVGETHSAVAQSKSISLVVELPQEESRQVSLDASLFQRVLDNLLSNALKFSPPESTVTLRVQYPEVEMALLEHGPLDTIRLRREARMSANSAKSRFDRGLVELQVGLKVLPVGVTEAGAWRYAFLYELLPRWFPDVPEQARQIGRAQARRALVSRYLDNIVATGRKMIGKVFHVLKWTPAELDRTIDTLLQDGAVRETEIKGMKGLQLVSTRGLDHVG